jgi:hypothetical protein
MHERLVADSLKIDVGGIADDFIDHHRFVVSGSDARGCGHLEINHHENGSVAPDTVGMPQVQGLRPKKVSLVKSVYSDSITMIQTNTSTATGGTRMA